MSIRNDRYEADIEEESMSEVNYTNSSDTNEIAAESDSNNSDSCDSFDSSDSCDSSDSSFEDSFFPTIKESRLRGLSPESRRRVTAEFYLENAVIYERCAKRIRMARKSFRKCVATYGSKYIEIHRRKYNACMNTCNYSYSHFLQYISLSQSISSNILPSLLSFHCYYCKYLRSLQLFRACSST